jgi:transcriptional regulator with XRE-family HTH domain
MLNSPKPRRKDYPKHPKTLGQHVKRRRADLGLRQRALAAELGVKAQTIGHWESGKHEPPVRLIPHIHTFLGFCPCDPSWTFAERLRAAREALGLSRRRAAELVGVDEATVSRAEKAVPRMARRSVAAVAEVLRSGVGS